MFEVGVVGQFEAAHSLRGPFGPATRKHGHTYRVEAAVRGTGLRDDGTLMDITVLQAAMDAVLGDMHLRDLDDVADLAGRNTTAEEVACFVWNRIVARVVDTTSLTSLSVKVWESPRAFALFEAQIGSTGEVREQADDVS